MNETLEKWWEVISPWLLSHGITILGIIIGAFIVHKLGNHFIEKIIRIAVVTDRHISAASEKKREDTLIRIFSWVFTIVLWLMVILMILQELGVPIGPIIAGAGIIGIAVGFGGQYLIKDIISGFFIILENQYRIGDVIRVADVSGGVEDISLRMTTLRDLDGTVHHVPHGEITKVSNMTKYFSRININIGVSYNAKLEHVIEVVNRVGNELAEDPEWKEVITSPPQFLRVDEFADSSVVVKILGETKSSEQWRAAGELRKRLKIAFDNEGIEIPFPQVVVNQPAPKA
ncbi:MAG: mechanosensitive ion channel family protein [Flavobacteriales bacterium]